MGDIFQIGIARRRVSGGGETKLESALRAISDRDKRQVGPYCDHIDRPEARGFDDFVRDTPSIRVYLLLQRLRWHTLARAAVPQRNTRLQHLRSYALPTLPSGGTEPWHSGCSGALA